MVGYATSFQGELVVFSLQSSTCFNFLFFHYYFFEVFANETETAEVLSGVAFITVELVNVNDNEPEFSQSSYNFTFDEEVPVDFVIETVTVSMFHLKCKCVRRQIVLRNRNPTRCIGNVGHIHVRNCS